MASILARTPRSVFHGRGRPPEVRSAPFPLRIPLNKKEEGVFVFDEDTHALRLKNEFFDLRAGYANPRGYSVLTVFKSFTAFRI